MKWGTRTQAVGGAKEGCGLWENCESRSRQQEAEAALAKHLPQAMQFQARSQHQVHFKVKHWREEASLKADIYGR